MRVKRLHEDAILPRYATPAASGLDLNYRGPDTILYPGRHAKFQTGLSVEIPPGFEGQVRPRSGLADRHGVTVLNSPGTIDSDFRGEVCVLLVNHGPERVQIKRGDRIAQLVIAPIARVSVEWADDLDETERGAGGFGSTGA